jgi:two-component system response regulator AlgR
MKIVIVDDEELARARLLALVRELGMGTVVAEASNGREAIQVIHAHQPHVVLLDILMPGMNGMEVAEQLANLNPAPILIFTTAYSEHAVEAFERQAIDYLLKPIRKERLEQALKRAYTLLQTQPLCSVDLPKPVARTHIGVYIRGEIRLIPVQQVYYFLANQKYVVLHWKQGEVLINEALKDLEEEFAGQFLRIHRAILVAARYIASLSKTTTGRYYIKLQEIEKSLEVSRRHLPAVKTTLRDMRIPGSDE